MYFTLKHPLTRFLLLGIAGIFYTLSFAPYDIKVLAYFSLLIFIFILLGTDKKSSIKLSFFYGFIIFLSGVYWIFNSIYLYGGENYFISILLTFLFIFILSLTFVPFGFIVNNKLKGTKRCLPLIISSAWVLVEIIRSHIFGGFPWLLLGTSQVGTYLDIFFPLFGTYFISFSVVLISSSLAIYFNDKNRKLVNMTYASLLFLLILIFNVFNYSWTINSQNLFKFSIIQPNIKQELKFNNEKLVSIKNKYKSLTLKNNNNSLVIWPETALPFLYENNKSYYKTIILENNISLLSGIFRYTKSNGNIFNSIVLLDTKEQFYDKRHLVPFGEYMPLKPFSQFLANTLNLPMSNLSKGIDNQENIMIGDINIYPLICYEAAYPHLMDIKDNEFGIIVHISNDAWFGNSEAPFQHLQIAQSRALESSRYLIRAANTGISAVINPQGVILQKLNLGSEGVINSEIYASKGQTPYMYFGDYPILMLIFTFIFIHFRQQKKYG